MKATTITATSTPSNNSCAKRSRLTNRGKARDAAANAERELQVVWNSIRVQPNYKDQNLWPPAEFDMYRWKIAKQIMAIGDAMK